MSLCDSCVHAHIYERANAMRQYHCLRLQAVKIPGDIVSCSDHDLRTAIDLLRQGIDVVINPADDGGYVLIGMNEPDQRLFAGMVWSVPTVMADTDWDRRIGWWLSGRLAGRDVSLYLPWRDRRRRTTQTTK